MCTQEKSIGRKNNLRKQYLFWRLTEVPHFFNDYALLNSECFKKKLCRPASFWQVSFFLKMHKEIKWNKGIPHDKCAYEVCENIKLIITGLNPKPVEKLLGDPDKVIDKICLSPKKTHQQLYERYLYIMSQNERKYSKLQIAIQQFRIRICQRKPLFLR